jgi:hypothetical protein
MFQKSSTPMNQASHLKSMYTHSIIIVLPPLNQFQPQAQVPFNQVEEITGISPVPAGLKQALEPAINGHRHALRKKWFLTLGESTAKKDGGGPKAPLFAQVMPPTWWR